MRFIIIIFTILFITTPSLHAGTEHHAISKTLHNYINGTSYNYPEQIKKAFYRDANLLLSKKDIPVWKVPTAEYVSWYKKENAGKFTGRIGEILNISRSGNIATAKVELIFPKRDMGYIDLFLLKKIAGEWKIISKTAERQISHQNGKRILFILSSASFHGSSNRNTGVSFSEVVNAYKTFKTAGYTVDFMSPKGGKAPLSYITLSDPSQHDALYDSDLMYALSHTKTPDQITAKNYAAVHYVGGGAAMYGVAENKAIQKISMSIYEDFGGIISAVCHGTAGIVHLKTKDGEYLVSGKTVSGYPEDYEKKNAAYFKQFPFLIKKTIQDRNGTFKFSARNNAHVEVDGRLITGQNHLSSALVAQEIIKLLEAK